MANPFDDTLVFSRREQFADSFFSETDRRLVFEFGSATHVGLRRSQNQDHFAVIRRRRYGEVVQASLKAEDLAVEDVCDHVMVVVDGIGGMKSGELASRLALQSMVELAGQATSWVMKLTDPDAQQYEERVAAYARRIHSILEKHGASDAATVNMGTTWTSAHLMGARAVIVHIGDSRAYRFCNGQLDQLTTDDTMAQALIDAGTDPASVGKFRHVLINCLGGGNATATTAVHGLEVFPGDRILLCTDGLTDMISDDEITAELSRHTTSQAACDALVERALENGGKDNVTIVLATAGDVSDGSTAGQ